MFLPQQMSQFSHFILVIAIDININFKLWIPSTRFSWFNVTYIDIKFLNNKEINFNILLFIDKSFFTSNIFNARTSPWTWFFNENIIGFPSLFFICCTFSFLGCWLLLFNWTFSFDAFSFSSSSTSVIFRIFLWKISINCIYISN